MIKRILSALLIAALILGALCCCGDRNDDRKKTASGSQPQASSQTSPEGPDSSEPEETEEEPGEESEEPEGESEKEPERKPEEKSDPTDSKETAEESDPPAEEKTEEEIEYVYEYEDGDADTQKSVSALCSKSFTTLPAEHTSLLSSNPDRGWRSEEQIWVPNDPAVLKKTTYKEILGSVKSDISTNTLLETVTISRLYFIMNRFKDTYELPKDVYTYLENYLKAYREVGVKVYLCIYYQHGLESTDFGAPKETILHHIDTYAKLWKNYTDVIYAVNFGLMGSYGEWSAIKPVLTNDDKTEIVNKVMRLVPKQTYLLIRLPRYKQTFIEKSNPRYGRIGYAADAFFGKMFPNDDYGQSTWRPDTEDWATSIKESPYTVMDGELFTTRWFKENGIYVEPYSSIQAMSELHLTTFSVNHGYADYSLYDGAISQTVLYGWKCEEITRKKIGDLGVLSTPTWFTKADGTKVQRNVFEYVRDYLGYNLAAQKLNISGGSKPGSAIKISMSLKNYGFSAAFNLKSGFAILDENNKVISRVYAGDPTKWYSTDPENYSDRTQLTHNVTANMTLPKKKGVYKIAFFMENTLGQTARLNNTVEYADGFNILHMFTVD